MNRYLKVWLTLSSNSFQAFFHSRIGAVLFLFGKILRFFLFLMFLILLVSKTKVLAGYNFWEVLLFYMTFNLIDATTQMLFREVYRFRQQVVSGNFDLVLVKPVNSLFRALFGGTDLLDLITLVPFLLFISIIISKIPDLNIIGVIFYFGLIINSLVITMSFHIIVLALAILTTEIDHAIMIYRDFTSMGRLPVNVYEEPLRSFITFVIPVGIMMSFPVNALLRQLNFTGLFIAVIVSLTMLAISLTFWNFSLKKYTSASS